MIVLWDRVIPAALMLLMVSALLMVWAWRALSRWADTPWVSREQRRSDRRARREARSADWDAWLARLCHVDGCRHWERWDSSSWLDDAPREGGPL
ncbi:MAG: hypothetical protein ABW022_15835 [Actinoplanes sp.]